MTSANPEDMPVVGRDLKGITLERHLLQRQRQVGATGEFTALMQKIATASKIVNAKVNMAGLAGLLGLTGTVNVQGEQVQRLDDFANSVFKRWLETGGTVCVMASEEEEDYIPVPPGYPVGRYVVLFDPCDGSSNIDVNVAIGTIFSVLRKVSNEERGCLQDCLQSGLHQVAAGYIVYGSSTMLVMTTGMGVHGFTLDPSVGEYFLSHPHINTPLRGRIVSANEGNSYLWDESVQNYVNYLKTPDTESGRPYTSRYIGSLVADFHRNLLKGGVFLYPADRKNKNGKLRLLYEANPMSFLIEQAGGMASNGHQRIMEIEPKELHQRTPLFIGSHDDVKEAEEFIQGKRTA